MKSHRYLSPFKSYGRIRFYGRHLGFAVARDGIAISTVGFLDLENRGVAVGISFLCVIDIELEICLGSLATPLRAPRVNMVGPAGQPVMRNYDEKT